MTHKENNEKRWDANTSNKGTDEQIQTGPKTFWSKQAQRLRCILNRSKSADFIESRNG